MLRKTIRFELRELRSGEIYRIRITTYRFLFIPIYINWEIIN